MHLDKYPYEEKHHRLLEMTRQSSKDCLRQNKLQGLEGSSDKSVKYPQYRPGSSREVLLQVREP